MLIAQQTKAILEDAGIQVDLLPTTIPVRYRAQAFVDGTKADPSAGQRE